jgi:hypothetical protein
MTDDATYYICYFHKKQQMKYRMKTGMMVQVMLFFAFTATGQGLFESSLAGSDQPETGTALSLGGYIRALAYLGNIPEEAHPYLQSGYGETTLLLDARGGNIASARAEVRFRYGTEFQHTVKEIELREAYVDLDAGPATFSIGKKIITWGKATFFNPTQKINPMDPTVRSPEEDDMYRGAWAVQGRLNMGRAMRITGTWKPIYQPSVLLIDPVPMPGYVTFVQPDYPSPELRYGSYGVNFDLYTSLMDGSLYWFDGYNNWPGIAFDTMALDLNTLQPAFLDIQEKAYTVRMLGMDLSIPLRSWVFRLEGAWQHPDGSWKEKEYIPLPEIACTAEIERTGTYLTMLAGYYGKYILEYERPAATPSLSADPEQLMALFQSGVQVTDELIDEMTRQRLAAFNRLYNDQLDEIFHSVFLMLRGDVWHDRLEFTLPVVYRITTDEWIIQPGISYTPADGVKISAGFSGFYGPQDSLYDLVGPVMNAGYLSMKVMF